jgi:ABC-2 type transport system permease protein
LVFFLWDSVFSGSSTVVFGYDRGKILTYVFGILIIRAIVFSSRTVDIAKDIGSGDLSNYLLKPINYFKYWFTRDISSKALNLIFAFFETIILYLILRPPFFFQTNPFYLLAFLVSLIVAVLLFFSILFLINMVAFWLPEMGWAFQFLFIVIIGEFLSGSLVPLDIFPRVIQNVIYALPFPYLVFFPLQIYIGKISAIAVANGLAISIGWLIVLLTLIPIVWQKGLKRYAAEGR